MAFLFLFLHKSDRIEPIIREKQDWEKGTHRVNEKSRIF